MLDSNYDVIAELLPDYEQTDCPISVKYYSIFKEKNTGKFYIRLTFINVGKVQIVAFKSKITCLDSLGELVDQNNSIISFTFQDLAFPAKSEFRSNLISINDLFNTRKLRVMIEKALNSDGSEWVNICDNFNRTKSIKLPTTETQNLLKDRLGLDAIITPQQDDQSWYCVCGNRNILMNTSCSRCGRDKNAVLSLDLLNMPTIRVTTDTNPMVSPVTQNDSLNFSHSNEMVQQTLYDKTTITNTAVHKHKNKRKKLITIISSVVLLAMVAVGVVGWFFIPFIKYEYACYLFNHYRYEEAEVQFESMGDYSLSVQNRNFAIAEQIYTNIRQGSYQEALDKLKAIDDSTASYLGANEVTFIEAYCLTLLGNNESAYQLYKKIPNFYSKNLGKRSNDGLSQTAREILRQEFEAQKVRLQQGQYVDFVMCLKKIEKMRLELERLPVQSFVNKSDIEFMFNIVKKVFIKSKTPTYYYDDSYIKYAYLKTGDNFYGGEYNTEFSTGSDFGLLTDERLTKYPLSVKWYKVDVGYLETEAQIELITEHELSNTKYPGWYFYFDNNNFAPGHYYAALFAKTPMTEITIGYFPFEIN